MLTKEEFERDFLRMMDSLRDTEYRGTLTCDGVACKECPINDSCGNNKTFETIEIVEKWSKEHPIVTMKDKFKEIFGCEPRATTSLAALLCPISAGFYNEADCIHDCAKCTNNFWNSEFKPLAKENDHEM